MGLGSKETLDNSEDCFASMEDTASLDISYFRAMYDAAGQKKIENLTLEQFPNVAGEHKVPDVLARVKQIKREVLYQYVNSTAQGSVNLAIEMLDTLMAKRLPAVSTCKGTVFKDDLADRFKWLCWVKPAAGSSDEAALLTGKEAATALYQDITVQIAEGTPITYDVLRPLHMYNYLLTDIQKAQHTTWVGQMFAKGSLSSSKAAGSGVKTAPAGFKKRGAAAGVETPAAKKKAKDGKAAAKAFFEN